MGFADEIKAGDSLSGAAGESFMRTEDGRWRNLVEAVKLFVKTRKVQALISIVSVSKEEREKRIREQTLAKLRRENERRRNAHRMQTAEEESYEAELLSELRSKEVRRV